MVLLSEPPREWISILLLPLVTLKPDWKPTAMLNWPVVFLYSAPSPEAVLREPVLFPKRARVR